MGIYSTKFGKYTTALRANLDMLISDNKEWGPARNDDNPPAALNLIQHTLILLLDYVLLPWTIYSFAKLSTASTSVMASSVPMHALLPTTTMSHIPEWV